MTQLELALWKANLDEETSVNIDVLGYGKTL